MPTPNRYMIVTSTQGVIEGPIEGLHAAAELRGYGEQCGTKRTRGSIALRPEIEGQPMFPRLVGPMYGGEGVVRYEDRATHDRMSV